MLTWKTDGLITAEHNGYTYTINGPTPNDDSWGVEVDILNITRAGADSFPFSDAFATLEQAMDYCERVAEEASRAEE